MVLLLLLLPYVRRVSAGANTEWLAREPRCCSFVKVVLGAAAQNDVTLRISTSGTATPLSG